VSTVTTLDAVRSRRAEILAAARRRRASRVRVFGSVARGEAEPDSDVDFLVDFDDKASLLDQVGLIQDLHELLGLVVDVLSSRGLRSRHDRSETKPAICEPGPATPRERARGLG
jgi:uncharacterized protein